MDTLASRRMSMAAGCGIDGVDGPLEGNIHPEQAPHPGLLHHFSLAGAGIHAALHLTELGQPNGSILLVDLPGVFLPDEDMVLADILELFHVLLGDYLAPMKGRALPLPKW